MKRRIKQFLTNMLRSHSMPQAAKVASIGPKVTQKIRSTPAFDESYQKLNAAQKKAVDVIEGPVMVIAGPGTGKTQTLAMRVANILAKTQMRPSNILCLTFSTSGAKAMRERLRSIIGPDAYGITIDTVHSFCNHIILEHPHVFEDFRAYEQVTQIEQLRIMRRLMEKLGVGSILGEPSLEHDRASAILNRISTMKREGISPDDLAKIVPEYRSEIETTKSGKPRDQKSQSYKDDQRLVQQFEEFILLYRGYDAELKETHRYDYADMILVVIEALKRHDWLLPALQKPYLYPLSEYSPVKQFGRELRLKSYPPIISFLSQMWLPEVMMSILMPLSSSYTSAVMPNPPAAFSPLAITASGEYLAIRPGRSPFTADLPGLPIMSPIKSILAVSSMSGLLLGVFRGPRLPYDRYPYLARI